MKNRILIILLSALIAVSLVSGLEQLPFKNAILLEEGVFNPFGIRLNDSFEVTGDINVNLANTSDSSLDKNLNFIGYSSKTSINVNDVIFYREDGSSLGYQDAKTNGWIEGINLTIESIPTIEATTLVEYGAYWVRSFLAVNMTFPNVGGSDTNGIILVSNLSFFNGTDSLFMNDARTIGWVQSTLFWNVDVRGSSRFESMSLGDNLNTWTGYLILSEKPNIYLLFENTTIPPPNIIMRYDDGNDTAIVPEHYIDRHDDGTIEISVPRNVFRRFVKWIRNLA